MFKHIEISVFQSVWETYSEQHVRTFFQISAQRRPIISDAHSISFTRRICGSFLDWSVVDGISGTSATGCLVLFFQLSMDGGHYWKTNPSMWKMIYLQNGSKFKTSCGFYFLMFYFLWFLMFLWYLSTKLTKLFFSKDPPIPHHFESLVLVTEKTYNKFYLQIDSDLLDNINGPITHVGVLVTNSLSGGFLYLFLMWCNYIILS